VQQGDNHWTNLESVLILIILTKLFSILIISKVAITDLYADS